MRLTIVVIAGAVIVLPGCNRPAAEQVAANAAAANIAANVDTPATATEARTEGGVPGEPKPLPEPKGPIDPRSIEAAGQVVQGYGALIEQGRWGEAAKLWRDERSARLFATGLRDHFRTVHMEIGEHGGMEGAAGSVYTTIPVLFYGESGRGEPLRMPQSVVLRRVNDVPGSTEEQRRWRIDRIERRPGG